MMLRLSILALAGMLMSSGTDNPRTGGGGASGTAGGDLTGTYPNPTIGAGKVVNADIANTTIDLTAKVTGTLPIANGGTGSATQNFVDLTTAQTITGAKTFGNTTNAVPIIIGADSADNATAVVNGVTIRGGRHVTGGTNNQGADYYILGADSKGSATSNIVVWTITKGASGNTINALSEIFRFGYINSGTNVAATRGTETTGNAHVTGTMTIDGIMRMEGAISAVGRVTLTGAEPSLYFNSSTSAANVIQIQANKATALRIYEDSVGSPLMTFDTTTSAYKVLVGVPATSNTTLAAAVTITGPSLVSGGTADQAGTDVTIKTGSGKGAGTAPTIIFQAPAVGTTGTALTTPATQLTVAAAAITFATAHTQATSTGLTATTSTCAAGNGTALSATADFYSVSTVTTTLDAVKLPACVIGQVKTIALTQLNGTKSLRICPQVGGEIDSNVANTGYTLVDSATLPVMRHFNCIDGTTWLSY